MITRVIVIQPFGLLPRIASRVAATNAYEEIGPTIVSRVSPANAYEEIERSHLVEIALTFKTDVGATDAPGTGSLQHSSVSSPSSRIAASTEPADKEQNQSTCVCVCAA